jgi:hypothetical protein
LEPGARNVVRKSAGKRSRWWNSVNYRVTAREDLSLSGGASIRSRASSS